APDTPPPPPAHPLSPHHTLSTPPTPTPPAPPSNPPTPPHRPPPTPPPLRFPLRQFRPAFSANSVAHALFFPPWRRFPHNLLGPENLRMPSAHQLHARNLLLHRFVVRFNCHDLLRPLLTRTDYPC